MGPRKSSEKFLEAAGFPTFACSSLKALFQLPCHFGTWGRFYLQIAAGSGRGQTRGRRRRTMVTGRRVEIPSAGARSRRLASPPGGDGHSPREATRVAPLPRCHVSKPKLRCLSVPLDAPLDQKRHLSRWPTSRHQASSGPLNPNKADHVVAASLFLVFALYPIDLLTFHPISWSSERRLSNKVCSCHLTCLL